MMMAQALQEDAQFDAAQFDEYQSESATNLEEDELMTELDHASTTARSAIRPFSRRVAASPSKVANIHLKTKEVDKKGPATPTK